MFEGIPGNRRAQSYLERSVREGRLAHALLFYGKSGVFKATTALALADALLCSEKEAQARPCGVCGDCRLLAAGNHPDLVLVSRFFENGYGVKGARRLREDKAPKSISVDVVRAVKADMAVRPFRASHKVYLFFEADLLTPAAQNSLLKILEEPPSYVVILLLTNRREALLDTVCSRCVPLAFEALLPEEVAAYLTQRYPAQQSQASLAAHLSGGSVKEAVALLKEPRLMNLRQAFFETLALIFRGKRSQLLDAFLYFESHKSDFSALLALFQSAVRDMILLKTGCGSLCVNTDAEELLRTCAREYPLSRLTAIQQALLDAERLHAANGHYNLMITQLLLRCGREDQYDKSSRRAV